LIITGVQAGTADAPVVTSPAGGVLQNAPSLTGSNPIAAQIWVHDVTLLVNISNLTVDGANNQISGCAPNLVGILYQNASGAVTHVATRNQILSPSSLNGCQSGTGILVQSGSGTGGPGPFTSTITVSNSTVHSFQKNGIAGQATGTTLTATGNTVLGQGPTTGAAENGIEIAFGATGKITGNSVSDFVFSPGSVGASGILLFDSGHVTITGNTVANTQGGIAIAETAPTNADFNTVTGNKIFGTHLFDGIDLCSDNNTVKSNIVNSSDQSGIHIDSGCTSGNTGNVVTGNTINEACAGILTGATPGSNTFSPDTFFNVGTTVLAGDTCGTPVFTGFARTSGGKSIRVQP
jgi:parallel beta-helix repeat protein